MVATLRYYPGVLTGLIGEQTLVAVPVGVEHLRAALAVWNYCEVSAVALFGKMNGGGTTTPSSKLLEAIKIKPGILRSELWDVVGHKIRAEELTAALNALEITGQAYHQTEGRREVWFPGGKPDGGNPEVATGPDDSPVHVSTFYLPPDEGVQNEGEDSALHCSGDFVNELVASRPVEQEEGGNVVSPVDPSRLLGDIQRAGGRVWKLEGGILLTEGVSAEHAAAIDANPQAVVNELLTEAEWEAEMRAM